MRIIRQVNRKRRSNICPDCKQAPKTNNEGKTACGCKGKTWHPVRTVSGTADEESMLKPAGFERTKDVADNIYYVGPLGHIIVFYPDGTWDSDKAADEWTMGEYLQWLQETIE